MPRQLEHHSHREPPHARLFPREQRRPAVPAMFSVTGKPIPGGRHRGNTTMASYPWKPFNKLDYAEQQSELTQDDARDGFQNLGGNSNFHFQLTGTAPKLVNGQGGNDTIILDGNSADKVFGGSGDDTIDGGAGDDNLNGQSGEDHIFGGAGADRISGGSDNDYLVGDNDAVASNLHGIDTMFGGSGEDTLYGGGKADMMSGGTRQRQLRLLRRPRHRERERGRRRRSYHRLPGGRQDRRVLHGRRRQFRQRQQHLHLLVQRCDHPGRQVLVRDTTTTASTCSSTSTAARPTWRSSRPTATSSRRRTFIL